MLKELYCLQNFDLAKTFSLRVVDCFANMMMPKLQLCYQTFEMVEEPLFPSNEIIPCKDPFANFVSKLWMDEWMSPLKRQRPPFIPYVFVLCSTRLLFKVRRRPIINHSWRRRPSVIVVHKDGLYREIVVELYYYNLSICSVTRDHFLSLPWDQCSQLLVIKKGHILHSTCF